MYTHIVLWKLKENANGMNRAQLAQEVKRRLDELPSHIPEIITYETGINVGTTVLHFLMSVWCLLLKTKTLFGPTPNIQYTTRWWHTFSPYKKLRKLLIISIKKR